MTDEIRDYGDSRGADDYYSEYSSSDANYDPVLAEIDSFIGIGDLDETIIQESQVTGRTLAECAMARGLNMNDKKWWVKPQDLYDDQQYGKIDFFPDQRDRSKPYDNPIFNMAASIAECVQFPRNTAVLHGCGIFSSLMIRKFSYVQFGDARKHPGLYTVAAQPPSSGKSPVNDYFSWPAISYIRQKNQEKEPERLLLQMEIRKITKEIETKGASGIVAGERARILTDKKESLEAIAPYRFGFTDATPEALEEIASKQSGRFSIISDEAEGVSVLTGVNYSAKNGTPNLGLILKGWDAGYQNTARQSREGADTKLFGAIAVLAQGSTVNAILNSGSTEAGSRGVCERFWILDEPNILHQRNPRQYKPVDKAIRAHYEQLVKNVIDENFDIDLRISKEAHDFIVEYKCGLLPLMVDGAKYSDDFLRSVLGKADTQICKMASVLHVAKQWSPGCERLREIQIDEVAQAASMYTQMIRCFVTAAEDNNIAGEATEMRIIEQKLKQFATTKENPRLIVPLGDLCEKIKRTKPFIGRKNLRTSIKEKVLPLLVASNHIVFDKKTLNIFINPYLKG
jgi:hypothetical protein